jgi:hypothetical protein
MSLSCLPCPAGKYCPPSATYDSDGTTVDDLLHPDAILCPKGYTCPTGTEDYLKTVGGVEVNACAVGSYNPYDGGNSASSCYHCPEGFECLTSALSTYPTI